MPVRIIVGAQWGDEGKGKVVDVLSDDADVVARYAGGPNAGHTVVIDDRTFILHLLPSGVLRPGKICVIGNGVVLNPETFFGELDMLHRAGISVEDRLFLSERAHIITGYHLALEGVEEESVEGGRLGTTRRGVGPAYRDKAGRVGLRVADLILGEDLEEKVKRNLDAARRLAPGAADRLPDLQDQVDLLKRFGEKLIPLACDTSVLLRDAVRDGKEVLAEGAQGTLLDIDHGTYPYVTSSNPVAGGACVGLGLGPTDVDEVIGVAKAYSTRVGRGPFPSELPEEESQALREAGDEYGATTGRPRRCGWFDAVALGHSVRVNGLGALIITKLDVLEGLDELKICTGYELDGERIETLPASSAQLSSCRPIYESMPGWKEPISGARSWDDLPRGARDYLDRIAELGGVPIIMASVGSDREHTVTFPTNKVK